MFKIYISFFQVDTDAEHQIPLEKFAKAGYSSTFLINSGQLIGGIIGLILLRLVVKSLSRGFKPPFHQFLKDGSEFPVIIKASLSFYFLFLIGAMLQILNLDFRTWFVTVSSIVAIITIIALFFVPVLIFMLLKNNRPNSPDYKEFRFKYEAFVKEYKDASYFARMFVVFELIEKAIFSSAIVIMSGSPHTQMVIIFLGKFGLAMLILKVKPFKEKSKYRFKFFMEGSCAILVLLIFIMFTTGNASLAIVGIGLVGVMIAINVLFMGYHEIQILRYIEA